MYRKYVDSRNIDELKTSASSMSLISNISSNVAHEKTDAIHSKYKFSKFPISKTNPADFLCDPVKSSDKNLQIYLTHLKIGRSEAEDPSNSSYKLYESFVARNSKKNIY